MIRLELEALNQKKVDEAKKHARIELEKRTQALNDNLARSWEEKQKAANERKKEEKRLKLEERKRKKQEEKKQRKEEKEKK